MKPMSAEERAFWEKLRNMTPEERTKYREERDKRLKPLEEREFFALTRDEPDIIDKTREKSQD